MDPHPLANLSKRSNYDEPIASELSALDYLYEVLLEIHESENCDEIYEVIHNISLNEKHDCNDFIINFINFNCAMQNISLGMLVLLCPLLIAMIMIGVIMLLMILEIYLSLMMNMFAIILSGFGRVSTLGKNNPTYLKSVQCYDFFFIKVDLKRSQL